MSTRVYKDLRKNVGRALHQYGMITDGEKIAVGLSGGKDSLTLMWILHERLSRIPIKYEIEGIYVDPGFENGFSDELQEYCSKMGYRLHVKTTDNGPIAHSSSNRENPCFLCSRLRRKNLFETADELGCTKLALGHHKDDIIETMFLNMCYAGEISTMLPSQSFFNGKFTIIRPLSFIDENTTIKFAKDNGFPEFEDSCPSSKKSKRAWIKTVLKQLYQDNRKVKGNIFRSLSHVKTEYLLDNKQKIS